MNFICVMESGIEVFDVSAEILSTGRRSYASAPQEHKLIGIHEKDGMPVSIFSYIR